QRERADPRRLWLHQRLSGGKVLSRREALHHRRRHQRDPAPGDRAQSVEGIARPRNPMRILVSAGEASSELYGAQLIEALRRRVPGAEFFGVGGERMQQADCDLIIDARVHLSVVGISEIVSKLPSIYAQFRKLIQEVDRRKPDIAVIIDSPAFNFRVARELHRRGVAVVYY